MKYYRLLDDINYPQRWYLGEILGVNDNWQFTEGRTINIPLEASLRISLYQDGTPLDFTTSEAYSVPIVSERVMKELGKVSGLQFIPVEIVKKLLPFKYFIMLVIDKKNAVNEDLSDFVKFGKNDPVRPDKAGHYSWFSKLILDHVKTGGEDVFRIDKGEHYLIVSERIKLALENIKATGVQFIEV